MTIPAEGQHVLSGGHQGHLDQVYDMGVQRSRPPVVKNLSNLAPLRSRRQGVHSPPHSINLSPRCPRLSDSPHHPLLVTHELEVAALETLLRDPPVSRTQSVGVTSPVVGCYVPGDLHHAASQPHRGRGLRPLVVLHVGAVGVTSAGADISPLGGTRTATRVATSGAAGAEDGSEPRQSPGVRGGVPALAGTRGAGLVGEVSEPLGETADPRALPLLSRRTLDTPAANPSATLLRELPPALEFGVQPAEGHDHVTM